MNPFDFINAINVTKQDLIEEDPLNEKDYSPFLVNRGLSYFPDTVMFANEMNRYSSTIDKKWQFHFLLNSVSKKKRWSKWHRKDAETKPLQLVMEYYGYSMGKAKEVLSILSKEQLKIIEEKLNKGGK